MEVLIIEDEQAAAKRLAQLVGQIRPAWSIIGVLEGVEESIHWFNTHKQPDLVFSDIQLADGLAFEIYRTIDLTCPVIFTTAYDNYAIQAFKLNSIDYLLKPVIEDQLKSAIMKLESIQVRAQYGSDLARLAEQYLSHKTARTDRLIVRYGQKIKAVESHEMAYFSIDGRNVMLRTTDGKKYPVDETLDQLEDLLDPGDFFRVNRQAIVRFSAIDEMVVYSKSRIRLLLKPPAEEDIIVSTNRSAAFKAWLAGNR